MVKESSLRETIIKTLSVPITTAKIFKVLGINRTNSKMIKARYFCLLKTVNSPPKKW